jgi:hypothetical protein
MLDDSGDGESLVPPQIPRLDLFMQVYDMRNLNINETRDEHPDPNSSQLEDVLNNRN